MRPPRTSPCVTHDLLDPLSERNDALFLIQNKRLGSVTPIYAIKLKEFPSVLILLSFITKVYWNGINQ